MDRLTVAHHFDPKTGFIVADEVVALPAVLQGDRSLDDAARKARSDGRTLIAFTTADRCAPCQQFKKDALNDPRVVAFLASGRVEAVHVEVDRDGASAERVLGSTGIPMSHALRPDGSIERLPGMRSADDLLAWLERVG
jgi:thiol:disulfide interchange protein